MKLHEYLEQALGNKVSISVLRALVRHRGKIFTIRRLAEDAGATHPGVSATVRELEKFGVVQIQPVGRAYHVSLNEKSYVLNEIIEPIFKAEEKTLNEIILVFKNHLGTKKIISAAIFGSVSSGEEKEDSDIDVLIVSNDFEHASTVLSNAGQEIFLKFHSKVSPIIFSETEFKSKKKKVLIRSILDSHTMIYGRNLGYLSK